MDLKIGLFGQEEVVRGIEQTIGSTSNVELLPFTFRAPEEINRLIDQALMSDVYVFLGPLAYFYSKQIIEKKRLPAVKVFKDEYVLATTFFRLINKHERSLSRFSIDVVDQK